MKFLSFNFRNDSVDSRGSPENSSDENFQLKSIFVLKCSIIHLSKFIMSAEPLFYHIKELKNFSFCMYEVTARETSNESLTHIHNLLSIF